MFRKLIALVLILFLSFPVMAQRKSVADIFNDIYDDGAGSTAYKSVGDILNAVYDATNSALKFRITGDTLGVAYLRVIADTDTFEIDPGTAQTNVVRWSLDGTDKFTVDSSGVVTSDTVKIGDGNTYISKDGSNNMVFVDAVTGTLTLAETHCPPYIFIKATSQAEGDLHLSDNTNWNTSKAVALTFDVKTSSTDWDLYLLQNDNGYAADDANIPMKQVVDAGNGNQTVNLNWAYHDEDASGEVHLYYLDNSGSNTADIYIQGYKLR